MKKRVCLFLTLTLLLCACALAPDDASRETMGYMDSLDRGVTVPGNARRIAVTGPLSQVYILPLAGDLLVGVSNAFSADAAKYLPEEFFSKTEIGQLYGGKGEMDLEALLSAAPEIVTASPTRK